MSEYDQPSNFDEFIKFIESSGTRAITMSPEQKELYFRLVKKSIFPKFEELGEEVGKKGMPAPIVADTPSFYIHETAHKGKTEAEWLSLHVHTPIVPETLTINDEIAGNIKTTISVSDGANSVDFHMLESGEVVFADANKEGSERILDTTDALFDPIPGKSLFSLGNPAAWVDKVVQRGMISKMKEELANLEDRQE